MARFYTVAQVAKLCGMTRDGVHKARRRGLFPSATQQTNLDGTMYYRITREDVRDYLLLEKNINLEEVE